ncbi:hypothetical protein U1Q18_006715 [Sarracenia purpurea var. burkii]
MLTLTQSDSTELEVWAEEVFPWATEVGLSRAAELTLSVGVLPEQNGGAHPERRSSWFLNRPQRGPEQWALVVGAKQAVPSYRR